MIVHPDFGRLGGIENYLLKVCPYLGVPHVFCPIARRPGEQGVTERLKRILADYRRFWSQLANPDIEVVHLNPSLERKSFYREALFLLLARLRRKKTLVFFRGWSLPFQARIDRSGGRLFRLLYGRADAFAVLANAFSDSLRRWRAGQPVYRETTVIDDDALALFDVRSAVDARLSSPRFRLVFASRLMPTKGLATAIRALHLLTSEHPEIELSVAGSGDFAQEAEALAARLGVDQVRFLGPLDRTDVYGLLADSHALLFPTEHDEGLPNIIVEAMAFGLPIISRPVGGVPDFFISGVHGYLSEDTAPETFANFVLRIAKDPKRYRAMAYANHDYATRHFLASRAASRLEEIYGNLQRSAKAPEAP